MTTYPLLRDCEAVMVPYGTRVTLAEGDSARVTQALGGNFTVEVGGNLYRIDGANADALGLPPPDEAPARDNAPATAQSVETGIRDQLATCYDPEIPINILELGLIYECRIDPVEGQDGFFRVSIDMTLTAPGCGMGDYLLQEVRDKLLGVPGVLAAEVQLVFSPPWDRNRMSEAARLAAGIW